MENPYANSKTLVLKENIPEATYRSLLSKNLTTTTTQFNAELSNANNTTNTTTSETAAEKRRRSSQQQGNNAAATTTAVDDSNVTGIPSSSTGATAASGGGIKGAYVIKTTIKSPDVLLSEVDAESSLGLTAVDALAALFPPIPLNPNAGPFDPSATKAATASSSSAAAAEGSGDEFGGGGAGGGPLVSVARIDHADRMDVINLQERILQLLEEGKAKPAGICPIRESVYNDAFEELIRQIAVLCPERGLLLSALRNEMRETDTTYSLLFGTACQYAVRKALARDLARTMLQEMEDSSAEVRTAENRVSELRAKYEGQQKRAMETRAAAQKVHDEEVAFIKKGTLQHVQEIKRLTALAQQQQQQKQ